MAQTEGFNPAAFSKFTFGDLKIDRQNAVIELHYWLDEKVEFVETVSFGESDWPTDPVAERVATKLAGLLHLLAGTSYYKTAAPPLMQVGSSESLRLTPQLRQLLQATYTLGLGEFAYENQIDLRQHLTIEFADESAAEEADVLGPQTLNFGGKTLVPIGGGKDSIVALKTVLGSGREAACYSVRTTEKTALPIAECVRVSGLEHVVVDRRLSPNISRINKEGALNGHVPVTAVVSLIGLIAAVLSGGDTLALANERSASEANLDWNGFAINHQWSKGIDFERMLQAVLSEQVATDLHYLSVLRPAGELAIAAAFAQHAEYHSVFRSCNKNFIIDLERRQTNWCCDCPKCRFVFLALAPWLSVERLAAIFGKDMLSDLDQLNGFASLAGLDAHKPFECVGEEHESLTAIWLCAHPDSQWSDHPVIREIWSKHLAGQKFDLAAANAHFQLEKPLLDRLPDDLSASLKQEFRFLSASDMFKSLGCAACLQLTTSRLSHDSSVEPSKPLRLKHRSVNSG